MTEQVKLKVCSKKGVLLEKTVEFIQLPGVSGDIGFGHNHTASLLECNDGEMIITDNGKKLGYYLSDTLAHITKEDVTLITEHIESIEIIDKKRATESKERAEKRILEYNQELSSDIDVARARKSLHRAESRLAILSKYS